VAEKKNPARAEQIYANNAARVMAVRPGNTGEVSQSHIAWSERRGVPGVPSPLYYKGKLYSFVNGGIVFCREAKTGKLIYSERIGAPGYYYSSPVAADHKVYIASAEGIVVVLDASGDQLRVLARNQLGGPIMSTPALVEGKIYVRTEGRLYGFGN
jgi:outer membrane protein assembly factor BamB